jgi:O-antigen/teichoic acid export membrane protein
MKESSRFYSSLGLLMILNVIIKPVWIFGIDRQVQNTVGTEEYGIYFSLLNFSIVFSFLLDWGLTVYFNRQLAVSQENFAAKLAGFLFIKILFAALYGVIVLGIAFLSGVRNWNILPGVMAVQVLTSLFLFLRSILTANQWFSTDAWFSVIDKILMILIGGSFLYFPSVAGEMTINRFLLIQICSTLLAISLVLIVLFKKGVSFSIGKTFLLNREILKSALPFGVIVLLMSIHYRLDAFLLERIHHNGAYEAGLYAGAYRLLDAANMIGYLLASFLLPFIARQSSRNKSIDEVVLNSRHLLLLFSIGCSITVLFLAPWIQQVLYHNSDLSAITILQWCIPVLAGYSLVQVYGTVMTATGQIIPFCYITILSVLLNIVINLLLIPEWGSKGCCIAALISQGFCGIATILYVRKKSGINIHLRSLLMYIFIGAILYGFYYWSNGMEINNWIQVISAVLITLLTAVLLKLISIRKFRSIIKQNKL